MVYANIFWTDWLKWRKFNELLTLSIEYAWKDKSICRKKWYKEEMSIAYLFKLLNRFRITIRSDNVLQVAQHSLLMFIASSRFHQRDLFDFTLENQEAIVIQIHAVLTELRRHVLQGRMRLVEIIIRLVRSRDGTSNGKFMHFLAVPERTKKPNQAINQSINATTNQPTHQSINQPIGL